MFEAAVAAVPQNRTRPRAITVSGSVAGGFKRGWITDSEAQTANDAQRMEHGGSSETDQQEEVWVSIEMTFDHEEHRVDLCLILILAGMLGTRPGALVEGGKSGCKDRVLC